MAMPNIAQRRPYVQETEAGDYWWCACGNSQKQPFCDGSHKGSEFSPVKVTIESQKNVAWCGCKHTKNQPFCDGTHKEV